MSEKKEATAKDTRPLTARCRHHKDVEYTFKNLTRVKNDEILQNPGLGPKEMLELYEYAKSQIEIQKEFCLKVGAYPDDRAYMPVPVAAMTVDEEWCRNKRCDYNHVAEMVQFPVRKALSAPTITIRREIDPIGNVTIYVRVADAVHRVMRAIEAGEPVLMCLVTTVETVVEEAEIYKVCNYHRRAHSHTDTFKGRKAAHEEKVLHCVEIASNLGLTIATSSQGRSAYPVIKAVSAVESIYDKHGPDVLERVFRLISGTSNAWKSVESLHTDMLQGLALFVNTFEVPGFVNATVVEQMLHDFTPQSVVNPKATKAAIEDAFHVVLKSEASQNSRHMAVATALLAQYNNKIKRMIRDKVAGAAQLKELLKLWHEKKLPQYKHDRVVYYHDKLENVAEDDFPHEWAIPEADSGFFPSHNHASAGITR